MINIQNTSTIQWIGAGIFMIALLHTFSTKFFEHLAHHHPKHAGLWHLLGEVEVVFGFWAMILMGIMFAILGQHEAIAYLDSRNFTEPMFVFAIMVIAGTRPVLHIASQSVLALARCLPMSPALAFFFLSLSIVPLLGSLMTEPAAMTLAALMLRDRFFTSNLSDRLKYATLGVLFVNISIGGTLTPFAAPPVLMVAAKWHWDTSFMFATFGWKAAVAVLINAMAITALFRKELLALPSTKNLTPINPIPNLLIAAHLLFLYAVVAFAHHPPVFLGVFLLFLGVTQAYQHYQDRLILREGLLVAFFLGGLVVLGGLQQWWLEPILLSLNHDAVYFGATALTAITDNAALTYLGSLVDGLSDPFKYALVAGAVTGGGLTIIANAPNPAGVAILREHFTDGAIHPLALLIAACPPTVVAIIMFWMF
jgi:hypothetical protein